MGGWSWRRNDTSYERKYGGGTAVGAEVWRRCCCCCVAVDQSPMGRVRRALSQAGETRIKGLGG